MDSGNPIAAASSALLREAVYRQSQGNTHSILAVEARRKGTIEVASDHEEAARANFDRELELVGLAYTLDSHAPGPV